MQSEAATVPAYLKELDADSRKVMTQLREIIRKAAPKAVEGIVSRTHLHPIL